MTLDKTLQRIIQRAERTELMETGVWSEDVLSLEQAIKNENARLLPIIQGLCEEVQRLQNCVDGWQQLIDDSVFVRNRTVSVNQYHKDTTRARAHSVACHSTSALEKLGGEK